MSRWTLPARAMVAALGLASLAAPGCDDIQPPPGSCQAGARLCYREQTQDRVLVLRCSAGELAGAIWIVEDVCWPEEVCRDATCVPR